MHLLIGTSLQIYAAFSFLMLVFSVSALADAANGLEEVTVTARKRDEKISNVSLTMQAFTAETLSVANVNTLDEISRLVPAMQFDTTAVVSGSSNIAVVYIRGVGQPEFLLTNDSGVGIYVDGVYLARNIGSVLSTDFLESIEILKGPQGTLFGKNTIGGALNVNTRDPASVFRADIKAKIGLDHRQNITVTTDLPLIEDKLTTYFSLSSQQIDGYGERLIDGKDTGNENRLSWANKWLINFDNDWGATIFIDGQRVRENGSVTSLVSPSAQQLELDVANSVLTSTYNNDVGQSGLLPDGSTAVFDSRYLLEGPDKSYATGSSVSDLDALGVSLTIEKPFANVHAKSISSYRDLWAEFGRDPDNSPLVIIDTHNWINHFQFSQEFQLMSDEGGAFDWLAGLYYFNEQGSDRLTALLTPELFSSSGLALSIDGKYFTEQSSVAAYANIQYDFTHTLTARLGLRWTEETKHFKHRQFLSDTGTFLLPNQRYTLAYNEFSPYAGLDWSLSDTSLVYFSYAKGFKSGGFVARYIALSAVARTFKPEYVKNYELGFKYTSQDKVLTFNAASFYADYEDIQVLVFEGIIPLTKNAANGRIRGFEFDARFIPLFGSRAQPLQLSLAGAYLDAEYRKVGTSSTIDVNADFVNTPRWTANVGVQYQWQLGFDQLQANLNYHWRSRIAKDTLNTPFLIQPNLGLLSAKLAYAFDKSKMEIAFYGENLTNERYFLTVGSDLPTFGFSEGIVARGREWGVELRYLVE